MCGFTKALNEAILIVHRFKGNFCFQPKVYITAITNICFSKQARTVTPIEHGDLSREELIKEMKEKEARILLMETNAKKIIILNKVMGQQLEMKENRIRHREKEKIYESCYILLTGVILIAVYLQ